MVIWCVDPQLSKTAPTIQNYFISKERKFTQTQEQEEEQATFTDR